MSRAALIVIVSLIIIGSLALMVYVGSNYTAEPSFNVAKCQDQGGFWVKGFCYTPKG